ncbi:MAG: hypothetical protein U5S82_19965 [Gammaproteobacteria bacterium]|nr:hypothetical protein [Gammaproteobacteria bacterium]
MIPEETAGVLAVAQTALLGTAVYFIYKLIKGSSTRETRFYYPRLWSAAAGGIATFVTVRTAFLSSETYPLSVVVQLWMGIFVPLAEGAIISGIGYE